MARPRSFDETQTLDQAISAFRSSGYHGTSVRDLEEATGLHASSLYRCFGDKHGLFVAALDRYVETESADMRARMGRAGTTRGVLRSWLLAVIDEACADPTGRGCLVVDTVAELGTSDEVSAAKARETFAGLRGTLTATLRAGQDNGDVSPALDAEAAAQALLAAFLGLKLLGRAGVPRATLAAGIDGTLNALEPIG